MGFRAKWSGLFVGFVLLSGMAWGTNEETVEITVLVNDSAKVSPPVMKQAKLETARIMGAAGIRIEWVDCSDPLVVDPCLYSSSPNVFMLNIVHDGKTATGSVFGEAFLDADGRGKYFDVFFDRIQQVDRTFRTNRARLLGTIVAHELGHLLLGSHAHAQSGIMEPIWQDDSLRQMGMGKLLFSREQSNSMRERMGRRTMVVSLRRPVEF